MNNLLKKQLAEQYGHADNIPESLQRLLEEVSQSYDAFEKNLDAVKKASEQNKNRRKLAEKENSQHEIHLAASQRIAQVGSWEVDIIDDGDITFKALYWTVETYRILGYEPSNDPINNDMFFDRVHPDDRQLVMDAVMNALATGSVYDIEHRLVLPDGTQKIVHGRSDVIKDERGKPIKMIGTIQDITARKKAREKLLKANEELRTLFENMQEVYFSVDMETYTLLQMSRGCEKVYGLTVKDFAANSNLWYEVILPEDKPTVDKNYPTMYAGQPFTQQYRIKHANGDIRWLESKITPTLNKEGKLIRLDGITADITERKENEIALKTSEYRFRTLIQNASDVVTVIGEDSTYLFASDSMYRVTGYKPEELVGTSSKGHVHPDDIKTIDAGRTGAINKPDATTTIQYRRLKKDGSYVWVEGTAQSLLHDPAIQGVVINFRDITERKAYEEALFLSNEELRKSNKELDRFVYSVSHDLRAPLSSMLGIIGLMQTEATEKNVLEDIGLLKTSIRKLDGFIQDILDYSRNSRSQLNTRKINFGELLTDVKTHLKHMVSENEGVDIKIEVENDIEFYTDPNRLSIIFNNLISNAIRYYNPKEAHPYVAINIRLQKENALITVKDNGIGIGVEHQEKIFDMFYRVSKKSVGSGLGLYIVKETVEKLNGLIKMESEPEKGTQFTIIIPNLINTESK